MVSVKSIVLFWNPPPEILRFQFKIEFFIINEKSSVERNVISISDYAKKTSSLEIAS